MDKFILQISKDIEKYYDERYNIVMEINKIKSDGVHYKAYAQERYFDGGGYMWANEKEYDVPNDIILPYLRKEKIGKIKNRTQ